MIRGSLLALLGLASFVAVYVALDPRAAPSDAADEFSMALAEEPGSSRHAPPATATADTAPAETASIGNPSGGGEVAFELRPGAGVDAAPEAADAPHPVRDVTPPNMTAAPRMAGPLTRVAPPEPPAPGPEARTERLFKPIVVAAGTIKVRGRDIRLAGIAAPDFDARCGEGASAWPCGRMARAALRRLIRGRAIECEVPPGADGVPDPASCRVAGEDIAKWLVAQGWAKRDGDRYGAEEDAAREAKRGLWSKKRPGDQAELAASG